MEPVEVKMAAGELLTPTSVHTASREQSEILREKFKQLPKGDQSLFESGSSFLALNASFLGLLSNNLFRRALNIHQGRIISALPMVVLPFISTKITYDCFINNSLMEGNLNCSICTLIRGSLIGGVVGFVYPVFTALPLNAALAIRFSTAPMPNKENMLRYWVSISKPVFGKMKYAAVLQVACAAYLSKKHSDIYLKMYQLPEHEEDPEKLKDNI